MKKEAWGQIAATPKARSALPSTAAKEKEKAAPDDAARPVQLIRKAIADADEIASVAGHVLHGGNVPSCSC